MKLRRPKTLAEFRLLERLSRSGHSKEAILEMYEKQVWRSDVITLSGRHHCANCNQQITLHECLECGQTIYEGNQYE